MTRDIFEYINILLPRHKCVTIPSFGAFILNKEEAKLDFGAPVNINPPSYSITFNSRLHHDDGILSSYIQSINGNTYDRASKDIATATRMLRAQLLISKEIPCGPLGKLELIDSAILFRQSKDYTCPAHFGLAPIELTPLAAISHSIEKEEKTSSIRKRLVMAAASAAVIFLIAYPTAKITDSDLGRESQQAGYLKSLVETKTTTAKANKQAIIEDIQTINRAEPKQQQQTLIATSATTNEPEVVNNIATHAQAERSYYLVVGGETTENRALLTLTKFKREGFETAQILPLPQRYRIYVSSFDNMEEANRAIFSFRQNNPKYKEAWIHSVRN